MNITRRSLLQWLAAIPAALLVATPAATESGDVSTTPAAPLADGGTRSIGWVQIETSAGGTVLQQGDTGTCNGFTYQVVIAGHYQNDAWVVVESLGRGAQANQPAGSLFRWDAPRAGCRPMATVARQPVDGSGLAGGGRFPRACDCSACA